MPQLVVGAAEQAVHRLGDTGPEIIQDQTAGRGADLVIDGSVKGRLQEMAFFISH